MQRRAGEHAAVHALLNYRHSAPQADAASRRGKVLQLLKAEEHSNYAPALSVDDLGDGFRLKATGQGARRLCEYLQVALEQLVQALEQGSDVAISRLPILPAAERAATAGCFNATTRDFPREHTVQRLFEAQAQARPDALAVVHGEQRLTLRRTQYAAPIAWPITCCDWA